MTVGRLLVAVIVVVAALVVPAEAQRPWVEARSEHFTVMTDAGIGRARDIAWQFEQIREAMARTFPWIRVASSRPMTVIAARDVATMRAFAPGLWDGGADGSRFVSASAFGYDRGYIVVRADIRGDDVEGVSPYQTAYWSYAAQALADTSRAFPQWLLRGLSEVVSNTLVREQQIQLGRVLPDNLRFLRSSARLRLADLVTWVEASDPRRRPESLTALDSHAWAFVHFLLWADRGAYAPLLDKYVVGLLNGADATASLAGTIGDVSRFDAPLGVYVTRSVFAYASFATAAQVARERFLVRDLTPVEVTVARGLVLAAMNRPIEARAAAEDAAVVDASNANAELLAVLAEADHRDADLKAALERAVTQPRVSWYVPYRLATLLPIANEAGLQMAARLLEQSLALNASADVVWAHLGEVRAALGAHDEAIAAAATAVKLVPSSSAYRLAQARTFQQLERWADAQRSAGLARAMARTPEDREAAGRVLAAIAKSMMPPPVADSGAAAGREVAARLPAEARPSADASATPGAPGGDAGPGPGAASEMSLAGRINACYADNTTCAATLPAVVADCTAVTTVTSLAACREAGYILDVGIGMPAEPRRAAGFYTTGCERHDTLSCVRLATLKSLGRGVARDGAAALAVLEPACGGGTQEACFRLGLHLARSPAPADRRRAREVLAASCEAAFTESCDALQTLPPGR